MNEEPMSPGMPADQSQEGAGPPESAADTTDVGFSTAEQLIGAAAAYRAPLTSSVAASALLRHESDPIRRRQLTTLRNVSLGWWGVGAVVTVIGFVIVLSSFASRGALGGGCTGGPDKFAVEQTTYETVDQVHWTATYPCVDGGSTTVPVRRAAVPGEGP